MFARTDSTIRLVWAIPFHWSVTIDSSGFGWGCGRCPMGAGDGSATTPSSTSARSSVRSSQSNSRATSSSAFADSRRGQSRVVQHATQRVGHRRGIPRRDDQRGLAVAGVLAAAAVVGGDERDTACHRLERRLSEPLEPAADREHLGRRVLPRQRPPASGPSPRDPRPATPSIRPGLLDGGRPLPRPHLVAGAEDAVPLRPVLGVEGLPVDARRAPRPVGGRWPRRPGRRSSRCWPAGGRPARTRPRGCPAVPCVA